MVRRFCDICNKEIKKQFDNVITIQTPANNKWQDMYELCPSCYKLIQDFIKERKIINEKKNG